MKKRQIYLVTEISVVLFLCFFPLCFRMDCLAIRQWDEARNAVHTVEMRENHNYIVRYFQGIQEDWETKPPFLIWLQVASSKVFGLNELAIRFPVILSTCLTVLILVIFFARNQNRYLAYMIALVLVTSQGYIEQHVARTGDHDAVLTLLTTCILLLFYKYMSDEKPGPLIPIGLSILLTLAAYTKSVAAFFIVPGLFLSIFVLNYSKKVFRDRWFYLSILLFILLTGSYYLIREHMQPGYLNAVWHWELYPRYANTEYNFNSDTFWFYAKNFYNWRYTYWIWLLLPAITLLPFLMEKESRRFYYYILLNATIFFIVISSGSKGTWYDAPMYPMLAIIIGHFLYNLFMRITQKLSNRPRISKVLPVIILIGVFLFPYYSIVKKVSRNTEFPWDKEYYSMCYVLRDEKKLHRMPDPLNVVFEGYNAHLQFYQKARNYELRRARIRLALLKDISKGDTIIISQPQVLDSVKKHFHYELLLSDDPVKLMKVY